MDVREDQRRGDGVMQITPTLVPIDLPPIPLPLPLPVSVVASPEQQFVLEILKLVVPSVAAICAAFFAARARSDIRDLHVEINSRLTQLMTAEKKLSEQEGRDSQKLSEQSSGSS